MPEPIDFCISGDVAASIWVSPSAILTMLNASAKAGRSETGGILIGRYGAEGWFADVVEATPRPKGSRSGWTWFQRSNSGLSAHLAERWHEGLHYLGEWHFHPGSAPTPSDSDISAMWKVAGDKAYHCPAPILLILGGKPTSHWYLSATLFRDGHVVHMRKKSPK
ncbi:MAG: Mov34/MPN/PAD-1 family protein [Halomonadaceae bacterium]